ncbi:MAG TPA: sigma 54-interacting transcriptional regulator, partial [Longimicrobium sp.]
MDACTSLPVRESHEPAETDIARRVRHLSTERWRGQEAVTLIGRDPGLVRALNQAHRFAETDAPVLVTGETGTGKELFVSAMYLLGARASRPFIRVNCAQYSDSALVASELFGHRKGSFTGAVRDHRGVFEEADGGVVFLDEIGELSLGAQAMLLRAIGEGEIVPVGSSGSRRINVRVLAATNRDLAAMVEAGKFRMDLYYRLSFLQISVPPLRERGGDWKLMVDHYLAVANGRTGRTTRFSDEALRVLAAYPWPGNARELKALVEMCHCLCIDGDEIGPELLGERVLSRQRGAQGPSRVGAASTPAARSATDYLLQIAEEEGSFWTTVYEPFLARDLNRNEVRAIVAEGLRRSSGSYKGALNLFGVRPDEYLKFMDFLRH